MKKEKKIILAIDGPAGAGKSSAGKLAAKRLGFTYLDTGAMYRAVALAVKESGVEIDEEYVSKILPHLDIELKDDKIFLNGVDISSKIRTPEMDLLASSVSRLKCVREFLGRLQRSIGEKGKVVAEGRDMGTVIFPDAAAKVFLTATPEVRAYRRLKQLKEKGVVADYDELVKQIKERDIADSTRDIAPLKPASDAMVLDSTDKDLNTVVNIIVDFSKKQFEKLEH